MSPNGSPGPPRPNVTVYAFFSPTLEGETGLTDMYILPNHEQIEVNIRLDSLPDGSLPKPARDDTEFVGRISGNYLMIARGDQIILAEMSLDATRKRIILNQFQRQQKGPPGSG
jgi:hypothetical protein